MKDQSLERYEGLGDAVLSIPAFRPPGSYPMSPEYRNLALQFEGVSKIETVTFGHESHGTSNI
jgi:hypothetical protein